MKRLLLAAVLCVASIGEAQPTQAQYDSLAAKVAQLEAVVGVKGFFEPQIRCADMESRRPPTWFPGGEYDVYYRQRQLGCGVDAFGLIFDSRIKTLEASSGSGIQTQITGLAQRIASLEQRNNTNIPPGTTVFETDVVFKKKVCVIDGPAVGCKQDAQAPLQIRSDAAASILYQANMDGGQYQDSASHISEHGLSDDSGFRSLENGYVSTECRPAVDPTNGVEYQDCLKTHINPRLPYALIGTDSQKRWCYLRHQNGRTHERTQDMCFGVYEDQKKFTIELWRPGYELEFGESVSGNTTLDRWLRPVLK